MSQSQLDAKPLFDLRNTLDYACDLYAENISLKTELLQKRKLIGILVKNAGGEVTIDGSLWDEVWNSLDDFATKFGSDKETNAVTLTVSKVETSD